MAGMAFSIIVFLGLSLPAAETTNVQMAAIKFQSTQARTALLELYTSEGCSSCPPAEAWLSRLQDSPRLWRDFTPVAFHVDYWNYLGWKDAWSDATFSERQHVFAQLWRSENIYTPEFVLNGKEWGNWSTGKDGPQADGEKVGVLTVTSTDAVHWQASYMPEKANSAPCEINAALLAGGIVSEVKAGENKGRRLNHDFVVVNFAQFGMAASDGVAKGKFILDAPRYNSEKTLALAVWITQPGELVPLQATGGWLTPPAVDKR
jgi:hypothetical protein